MYICDECGRTFEEPQRWTEERSGDGWANEVMTASPCCGSGYSEARVCRCCGEELIPWDQDYCEICEKNMELDIQDMANERGKTFNEMVEMIVEVFYE